MYKKLPARWLFLIIAAASAILVLVCSFTFAIFQYGDNCGYMSLGMAFANGEGFTNPAIPGKLHFLWWPPGFPLLIALFYKIAGANWALLKLLLYISLYVAFIFYAQWIYINSKDLCKSLCLLLALCFSSGIHLLSSYLYSEIFFVISTLLFFLLWYKWRKRLSFITIGILSIIAVYISSIRLVGISLPIAFITHLLLFSKSNKVSKQHSLLPGIMLLLSIYIFLFIPPCKVGSFRAAVGLNTQFRSALTGTYANEKITATGMSQRYYKKLTHSLRGYGTTLIPQALIRSTYDSIEMNRVKAVFMGLVSLIAAIGWWYTFRRHRLINIYTLFFTSILFIYGPLYVRLVVPIIPFLFLYLYDGLRVIISLVIKNRKGAAILLSSLWIAILIDNMLLSLTNPRKTMPAQFGNAQYQDCIHWVTKNTKPKDVISNQIHSYLYLKRGPYSIPIINAKSTGELLTFLDAYNVRYILISPFGLRPNDVYVKTIKESAKEYPEKFKRVFGDENKQSYVLEYFPKSL